MQVATTDNRFTEDAADAFARKRTQANMNAFNYLAAVLWAFHIICSGAWEWSILHSAPSFVKSVVM